MLTSKYKSHVFYSLATLLCISAGAYIGRSGQFQQQTAHSPSPATNKTQQTPSLEIKYAYFGAPTIRMPSEAKKVTTQQRIVATSPKKADQQDPVLGQPNEITQRFTTSSTTVSRNDSFSVIAQAHGLSIHEIANIMENAAASKYLGRITPGEHINFKKKPEGSVEQITYIIDESLTLFLSRKGDEGFKVALNKAKLDKRIMMNTGVIESSLFLSAAEAGVSNRHIMQMVEVFRWDIDFVMDVQPNDSFKLIYEGFYKGEKLVKTGRLLGAEFHGRSRHRALYFENNGGEKGYYTARGKQLKKQFLRNPVDTVRITSPFNLHRKHPVLNTIKAHKGVDYGAPIGTPIKATASGIVKYSGRRGTYGLTVELQHGKQYTTLYAHMNKIHSSTTVGERVEQGQVIGYVGKTGRVTGAHLHYEFRIKGVHVNPQTVKFAGAGRISDDEMREFKTSTAPIMQQLNAQKSNRLALSR